MPAVASSEKVSYHREAEAGLLPNNTFDLQVVLPYRWGMSLGVWMTHPRHDILEHEARYLGLWRPRMQSLDSAHNLDSAL